MGNRSESKKREVILLDGQNFLFRAHYAHQRLQSSEGVRTSCLFGVPSMLLDLMERYPSADIVFVWDHFLPGVGRSDIQGSVAFGQHAVPSYKKKIGDGIYKINRQKSEESRVALEQGELLVRILDKLGFLQLGVPGLEADDLLGMCSTTLSADRTCAHVYILSGDTDMLQLVTDRCSVLMPKRGKDGGSGLLKLGPEDVLRMYGVPAKIFARYLALGGDKSDDYKAIPGVGPKKAVALLQAGLNPSVARFEDLPKEHQSAFRQHSRRWEHIHKCFLLAYIPKTPQYKLLPPVVGKMAEECVKLVVTKRRRQMTAKQIGSAEKAFREWCSKYEMGYLRERTYKFVRGIEEL